MLVNLYRAAIVQVFNGYFEEFEEITERMIKTGLVDEAEMELFSSQICLPVARNVSKNFGNKINDLKVST